MKGAFAKALRISLAIIIIITACKPVPETVLKSGVSGLESEIKTNEWVDLSKIEKPAALTEFPWQTVVIGVPDLKDVPKLFKQIGGFETLERTDSVWLIGAKGADSGFVRFEKTEDDATLTRPYGSQSWDTGCYFSVMMRAKNLPSIIEEARTLGWTPLTDMAYLEFGPSKLNIIVLAHKKTGIQVQLYERLTTPLPKGFTPFDRLSRPFNIMQVVQNRDTAYTFSRQSLGFDNFYFGKPTVSKIPEINPLGIPKDLSMKIPYHAGITTPKKGLEWGRMEMIQVDMQGGKDLSERCSKGNIGITSVEFLSDSLDIVKFNLNARDINVTTTSKGLAIKTPDGANIEFIPK